MEKINFLILFVISINFVSAQIPLKDGKCPDISGCIDKNFNFTFNNVKGYYYTYATIPFFFQKDIKCSYVNYVSETNNMFTYELNYRTKSTNEAISTYGKFNATNDGKISEFYTDLEIPLKYEIISLTPEYMIEYSCNTCGMYSEESAGIYVEVLSRLYAPSCSTVDKIKQKLAQCGIPLEYFVYIDNSNCSC